MDIHDKIIFVTGATGHQGGAVVKSLLKKGWKIRAMTRNQNSDNALNLEKQNIEVVEGNLNEPGSYKQHLENVYGVFSVQNFWEHGFEEEVREGKSLADAAQEAGVQHFVYSSVGSAHRDTDISHFESKWEIEQHLRKINIPYTIFRPVFFMENFLAMKDQILEGKLIFGMEPDVKLQMIAVKDIGNFVEAAFSEPDVFIGKEIDIAGDQKTFPEITDIFSREIGKTVSYIKLEMKDFVEKFGKEYGIMVEWFNKVGYDVNIEFLRDSYDVELTPFKDWVKNSEFSKTRVKEK